jgi:nucleoside-diphosphate kinase
VATKLSGLALLTASTALAVYQYDSKSPSVHCAALPVQGLPGTNLERTFLAVKPDGVQRGLIGDIIARFEKRGYKVSE